MVNIRLLLQKRLSIVLVILILMTAGYIIATSSAATGPAISAEPESGTTSNTTVITDTTASSGKAVRFPATSSTGCPNITASAYDTSVLADKPKGYFLTDPNAKVCDVITPTNSITSSGTPKLSNLPNGDRTLVFNGSSQYIQVPDHNNWSVTTTGAITLEAWIRPDVLQFPDEEGSGYVHWGGKGSSGQHEYVFRMYSKVNSENRPNRISGYSFNLNGGLGAGSFFQDPVSAGGWIHYALVINTKNRSSTYSTGYTKVFKNGVLRDQDALTSYDITPGNGTAPLRYGTRDFNSYFPGAISKMAVYDYELTSTQLAKHYQIMNQ